MTYWDLVLLIGLGAVAMGFLALTVAAIKYAAEEQDTDALWLAVFFALIFILAAAAVLHLAGVR